MEDSLPKQDPLGMDASLKSKENNLEEYFLLP